MLLRTKLLLGAVGLVGLLGVNSVADLLFMNKTQRLTAQTGLLQQANDNAQESNIAMLRFVVYKKVQYSRGAREYLLAGAQAMRDAIAYIETPEQLRLAQDMIVAFGYAQTLFYELEQCVTGAAASGGQGCDVPAVQELARDHVLQLISTIKEMVAGSLGQLEEVQVHVKQLSVAISLAALVFGAIIVVGLLRAITRPVASALHFAETVAAGNFSARWQYASKDEMGCIAEALNTAFTKVSAQASWFESILDSIPTVISVTDLEMRWTFLNKAAYAVLDAPRDELIGQLCLRLGSPVCGTDECGIARLRAEPALSTAHTVFSANGKTLAADCSYLTDRAGAQIGHVTFMYDVTESERLRLEAEAASRAKTAFLSTMSHEIRTPIHALTGFIHLFERDNLTREQVDKLDKMRVASRTLLDIVDDVLHMAAIEAGTLDTESRPFSLAQSLRDVTAIVDEAARRKDLDLVVSVAQGVPDRLQGDEKHLRQILLNLVGNAVKFTEQGEVRLHVDSMQADAAADGAVRLCFDVSDTGIGISEEQMDRLFIPFSQADTSISRRFGGTGLGLCLAKRLVELMGGSLSVRSQLGRGTTFQVVLPFTGSADTHDGAASPSPEAESHPDRLTRQWQTAGMRVLVVEDNPINQEIVVALLEDLGLCVDVASHGQEALEKVHTASYDAILMDMQMPVMDGLEATRQLRGMGQSSTDAHRWLHHVPIIAMTANVLPEDRQRCLHAGMNDHIGKPLEPQILQSCLEDWLMR